MDPQPDFDVIARRIVARQLSWSADEEPIMTIDGIEWALVVEDGDLTRATLWRGPDAAVARVDLSSLTVEAGASC